MALQAKTKDWIGKVAVPVILLLIAAAGVFFVYHPLLNLEFEFTRSIGHALIIAGILGLTVDVYAKTRLLREASRDIGKFLIGYPLPKEVQSRLAENLNQKFVRRNMELRYEILPHPTDQDKIRLMVGASFDLENITTLTQPYRQFLWFEKHTCPSVLEMSCTSSDRKATYKLRPTKEKALEKEIAAGEVKAFAKKIKLRSHHYDADTKYKIGVKYSLALPKDYNEYFFMGGVTIGVTVEANYPEHFEFFCPYSEIKNENVWEHKKVFLPGEQMVVRWREKKRTASKNSMAAT